MALQIAIVEDLQPDAQRLQALVRQELGAVECGIFPSGDAYLQQMPARKDDLVFLDICMEGTSGIETAQQLRRADPEVLIVFVTFLAGICVGRLPGAPVRLPAQTL